VLLDTYLKESSTTSSWNINLVLPIEQTLYPEDLTTKDPTQLMTTSLSGQIIISATITPQFAYLTWIVLATT